MHLRNFEGGPRAPLSSRPSRELTQLPGGDRQTPSSSAGSATSRGAFFDMMVSPPSSPPPSSPARPSPNVAPPAGPTPAAPPVPRSTGSSGARVLSSDENSSVRGGSRSPAPLPAPVRNDPASGRSNALESTDNGQDPPPPTSPPMSPVETLNAFLSKLGYDPASFNARVTSANISVPGISYEYPLLEVTVQVEKIGFHLPSAARDLRITAANISSMMGKPVNNLSVFA